MRRSLTFQTKTSLFVLPWDFKTVSHVISSQHINVNDLRFNTPLEKKELSSDLFLLATKEAICKKTNTVSVVTNFARDLMN